MSTSTQLTREDLESLWLPFTSNRQFKDRRECCRAPKDVLLDDGGRKILDGFAGSGASMPGTRARKSRRRFTNQPPRWKRAAVQMGHPIAFEFANVLTQLTRAISIMCSSQFRIGSGGYRAQD